MAKRRKKANGQGSISYIKGRKSPRWARLPTQYDINGKEHRPTVGFFKTKKEAEEALDLYDGIEDIRTFKEIYQDYKKSVDFNKLSKKTQARYDDAFLSYKPLWDKDIVQIKTRDLQACINQKEKEGYYKVIDGVKTRQEYSKDSLERLKHVASKIYIHAMKDELVDRNRAELLEIGGVVKDIEKEIFYKKDIDALFKLVKTNPDARHVLVMIFTGMRTSEYLNLKTENIDLKNGVIKDFGLKTKAGKKRQMFIHEDIEFILHQLVKQSITGYIVENTHISRQNKKPSHPSDHTFRKRIFRPVIEQIGLDSNDFTPYNCRYTFATIAHMSGMTDEALMYLMGHTNISVTSRSYIQDIDIYIKSELEKYNIKKVS
nr:MAG TPA: Integrase [Caudoviricetes sp.]